MNFLCSGVLFLSCFLLYRPRPEKTPPPLARGLSESGPSFVAYACFFGEFAHSAVGSKERIYDQAIGGGKLSSARLRIACVQYNC